MFPAVLGAFDIFHQKVQLNVNTRNKLSTSAGSVLTIIVVVITLVQSLVVISSIFDRTNPTISIQQEILQDPGYLSMNSSNFVFAITVQDAGFNLSSSYVSFQMQYRVYTRFPNGTLIKNNTKVPLKKCDLDYMRNFSADFQKLGINNALCPTRMEYDLGGTFLGDNYQFIKLTAYSCMNDTSEPDIICKPYEDVMKALINATVQVQVFFSNTIFTPINYSVPITEYMSNLFWTTLPGQQTVNSDIFVGEQVVNTDDNMWLSAWNPSIITSYQIDPSEERPQSSALETVNSKNFVLANIYFRKSQNKYITYRVFPKIQEGLVAIGGIFSVCVGVFGTLAFFYTRKNLSVTIANEMYEFDFEDLPDQKRRKGFWCCKKRASRDAYRTHSLNLNESALKISEKTKESSGINFYLAKFAKYSRTNRKLLTYSIFDFLFGLLCCRRRHKDRLVEKATKMVGKDIDIIQILKKLQEIDKLKKILLDDDQNNVFSYSRPPLVTLREPYVHRRTKRHLNRNSFSERKPSRVMRARSATYMARNTQLLEAQAEFDSLNKFVPLFESYQKLLKQESRSPLNDKILKLLDYEMDRTLFDMTMETRLNAESSRKYRQLRKVQEVTDMLEKKRAKPATKTNRLQAALWAVRRMREIINKKNQRRSQTEVGSLAYLNDASKKHAAGLQVVGSVPARIITRKPPPETSTILIIPEERKDVGMPVSIDLERQKSVDVTTRRRKESQQNLLSLGEVPTNLSLNESQSQLLDTKREEQQERRKKRASKKVSFCEFASRKETPGENQENRNDKAALFDKFLTNEAAHSSFNPFDPII